MKFNFKKIALVTLVVVVLACMMSVSAFAAGTGDVADTLIIQVRTTTTRVTKAIFLKFNFIGVHPF